MFVELFKHKERIVSLSELSEEEVSDVLNALLARVHFIDEATIPIGTWAEARKLCTDVDLKDTPFVALTIHLSGRLWTEDAELKSGLAAKNFGLFYRPNVRPL